MNVSSDYLHTKKTSSLSRKAAEFFGIKQRRVFQIIEAEAAHYTEIEAGAVMICLPSLATVLNGEVKKNQLL